MSKRLTDFFERSDGKQVKGFEEDEDEKEEEGDGQEQGALPAHDAPGGRVGERRRRGPFSGDIVFEEDPFLRPVLIDCDISSQEQLRVLYAKAPLTTPVLSAYPKTKMGSKNRGFSSVWFAFYGWLEYSVSHDAVYCRPCSLFATLQAGGQGGDAFVVEGWRQYNKGKAPLDSHQLSQAHRDAVVSLQGYLNVGGRVDQLLAHADTKARTDDMFLLHTVITAIRFLARQKMAFRGHDESVESVQRGNFLELLKVLGAMSPEVQRVLDSTPRNNIHQSPDSQKALLQAHADVVRRWIVEEIGWSRGWQR